MTKGEGLALVTEVKRKEKKRKRKRNGKWVGSLWGHANIYIYIKRIEYI